MKESWGWVDVGGQGGRCSLYNSVLTLYLEETIFSLAIG